MTTQPVLKTKPTLKTLYDEPGPRGKALNVIISALCLVGLIAVILWILAALNEKGQLTAAKWQPFLTANMWNTYLIPGILGTLQAAALAVVLATALGILLGVGRMSKNRVVSFACGIFVEFFRAMPLLILMIFCFQVFANYSFFPSTHMAMAAVVTGLTLCNGAVIAEIVRAGVHSLPRGQSEASMALGFSSGQMMRMILLPQAITAMLPPIVSQLVVALKDTALGYQITYVEAVRQGVQAGSAYSNYVPALLVVAVVMIAINFALSQLAVSVETRLRKGKKTVFRPEAVQVPQL